MKCIRISCSFSKIVPTIQIYHKKCALLVECYMKFLRQLLKKYNFFMFAISERLISSIQNAYTLPESITCQLLFLFLMLGE